jgi:hypothetical protein
VALPEANPGVGVLPPVLISARSAVAGHATRDTGYRGLPPSATVTMRRDRRPEFSLLPESRSLLRAGEVQADSQAARSTLLVGPSPCNFVGGRFGRRSSRYAKSDGKRDRS